MRRVSQKTWTPLAYARDLGSPYILDRLVIHGDTQSVADQILTLREQTGRFEPVIYTGHDWANYDLGRNSMILTGEKVMFILDEATKSETPYSVS